jgi:DNA-binding transcriptional MerR regulator
MLQQILFFRELGFPLGDIQRIITSDDFNRLQALESHKNLLKQDLDRNAKSTQDH